MYSLAFRILGSKIACSFSTLAGASVKIFMVRALIVLIMDIVRVPRACGYQSIHAESIISFLFQEHLVSVL